MGPQVTQMRGKIPPLERRQNSGRALYAKKFTFYPNGKVEPLRDFKPITDKIILLFYFVFESSTLLHLEN